MHRARFPLRRLVPLLVVGLLGACGGGDATTGPGPGGGGEQDPITSVEVSPSSLDLAVDETATLTATATRESGASAGASFTWTSRDTDVATVSSSGEVTAVGPGNTVVEATTAGVSDSAEVSVTETAPTAPGSLEAYPRAPDRISLSWRDDSERETGFEVQRRLEGESGFEVVGTTGVDATAFVDGSLEPATTYYYRVRALGEGAASEFTGEAEVRTLPPRDPESRFECERQGYPCTWTQVDPAVFDASDATADSAIQMLEEDEPTGDVLLWLQDRPDVTAASASEAALRFRLQGGRPAWVLGPDAIRGTDGAGAARTARTAGNGGFASASSTRFPEAVVGDDPKSKRALVLSPYRFQFGDTDDGPAVASILSGARGYEGNVDFFSNTATSSQVTLNQFKNWTAYDVIHVVSHGAQVCEDGEDCNTVVSTGSSSRSFFLESSDYGVDLVKIEFGERDPGASTDFFKSQYPQGLPDAIVFINACETSKGQGLAQVLTGNGGAYLGWTEVVTSTGAYAAATGFYQELVGKGVTATSGYQSLSEGEEDLTTDIPTESGAVPELEILQSGDDLRIREVVYPRNPLTKQDLPQDAPYPVVGQPEDGVSDRIPYLIKVDGVEGEPDGFTVRVTINGFSADPKALSEGRALDAEGNVWQVKGDVPVPFDAEQGQEVDVDARVSLPEGGESEWDESPELGNPVLRFASTIETEGGTTGPVVRVRSRVESELDLALDEDLEMLEGEDVLEYLEYDLTVEGSECTITSTTTTDGRLVVVDGDFALAAGGAPVLPERLVFQIPPEIEESYTVSCPQSTDTQETIHFFAGFVSFHSGELCGGVDEIDEAAGGFVIQDWTAGSGDVWARKDYDRSCSTDGATYSEETTLELIDPRGTDG